MSDARDINEGVSQAEVQPWHRLGGIEHICELRKSSQVLYSIFVTILRMMYSNKEGRTFGCPDIIWNKDPQKTEIWIDTELRWEDLRPDFTPAIYVNLSPIQYDFIPAIGRKARMILSKDGERHYERTGKGTVSFIHVCDRAGEACSLADNTENYLSMLQDPICEEYCFNQFFVVGRTPRQQKEQQQTAGKGKYISVVQAQYEFNDGWTVKLETPILKAVSFMENEHTTVRVAGSDVDVQNGQIEIEFGNLSTEKDTPKDI